MSSLTYQIFAAHAFSNNNAPLSPITQTTSRKLADQIVSKLKAERFTTCEGRKVLRYSDVFMRELQNE
jgi:hypothetical protein